MSEHGVRFIFPNGKQDNKEHSPNRAHSKSCSQIWRWGLIMYLIGLQKAWFPTHILGSKLQPCLYHDSFLRSLLKCPVQPRCTQPSPLDRYNSCSLHAVIPTWFCQLEMQLDFIGPQL